jgi:hypothetical protein
VDVQAGLEAPDFLARGKPIVHIRLSARSHLIKF